MLLAVCIIMSASLLTLYSAANGSMTPWAFNQGLRFGFLFVVMLLVSFVPVSIWRDYSLPFYGVTLGLLLIVELFGKIGMGAQRWIDLGIIRLQPSEFMKIAIVLSLASYFDRVPPGFIRRPMTLLPPVVMIGLPVVLVLLQPDLGTAMMIALAGTAILFLAGIPLRWFVGGGLAFACALPLVVNNLLHDYQRHRVLIFLDPESDPLGTGYHIAQSKIAIGSSGIWGKGFMQGTQSHLAYLPEPHTDFILATMMEEWGLVGGVVILLAYAWIIRWASGVAMRSTDRFVKVAAIGLSFTISLYVGINMAMVLGLAPVVGIPLPLLSYGGSAMMTVLILLGILMSFDRAERKNGASATLGLSSLRYS